MKHAVMCIVANRTQAESIVSNLRSSGFSNDDVSALFPDTAGTKDFAHEQNTKAPEGAVAGASVGGLIGGTLGVLAGIGLLAIPGLGPFVAAGPLMAGMSGIAAGAAVGGLTGALVGMGIPEIEAKRYEGKVKDGNILLSVHADTSDETKKAQQIFKSGGATDICSASEASAPKVAGAK